jgi:hypothetical protein
VNIRALFVKLVPLAIIVLPFIVAACKSGPGGGGAGY